MISSQDEKLIEAAVLNALDVERSTEEAAKIKAKNLGYDVSDMATSCEVEQIRVKTILNYF